MAKIKPGKPNYNNKAGGELKYKNVADVVGGPIDNEASKGLSVGKGVRGSKSLPPVKK